MTDETEKKLTYSNKRQLRDNFDEPSFFLEFSLPIEPVPKKRVRVYHRGGKIHGVNPSKDDEDVIRRLLMNIEKKPERPISKAALLGMKFYRSVPKSIRKRDRPFVVTEHYRPIKRPDLDNYIKLFKDAATGILWEDDNLIVGYLPGTGKYYTLENARIEIQLLTVGRDFDAYYIKILEGEIARIRELHRNLEDFF